MTVRVVEARARVGGRILTLRPDGAPLPVELGAEFVHGRPRALLALLEEAGASPVKVEQARWRATAEGLRPAAWEEDGLDDVLDALDADRDPDRSFAAYLAEWLRAHPQCERAVRGAREFVEGFHAADVARIGERALAHETQAATDEGEDESNPRAGRLRPRPGGTSAPARRRRRPAHRPPRAHVRWSRGGGCAQRRRRVRTARRCGTSLVVALPCTGCRRTGRARPVAFDPPLDDSSATHVATDDRRRAANRAAIRRATRRTPRCARRASRKRSADIGFCRRRPAHDADRWTEPRCASPCAPVDRGPRAERLAGHSERKVRELALDSLAAALHVPRERVRTAVQAHTYDCPRDPYARGATLASSGSRRRTVLAEPSDGTLFWPRGRRMHPRSGTVHGALAAGIAPRTRLGPLTGLGGRPGIARILWIVLWARRRGCGMDEDRSVRWSGG